MIAFIPYLISIPYAGLISFMSLGLYKKKYELKDNKDNLPTISLIISCRNEEKNLHNLLSSIDNLVIQPDEIILIDDNSSDNTFNILSDYAVNKQNIVVFKSKAKGKKSALIQASKISKYDYLMFTDADCILNPKHVLIAKNFISEYNSDVVLGCVDIKDNGGLFNIVEKIEFASLQAATAGSTLLHFPFMCNGANLIIKKDVYLNNTQNINLNIASGDDVFMLHSIKKHKNKIHYLYNDDYVVETLGTGNISAFISQRIRWASKSSSYKDNFTIFVETIIALTNIMLFISYLFSPLFYIIKMIIDSCLLLPYFIKYKQKKVLKYYLFLFPIMSFLYPVYIWIVGFAAFSFYRNNSNWK